MIEEKDVEHIAELADIGMERSELAEFTAQFNEILDYFGVLDQAWTEASSEVEEYNIFRDDEPAGSLSQEDVLANAKETEDGFFRAPRVM
ncbi:MAG: Asp-tRNA(Asn)/Glu-tRNA(Gln) amidotransferase subunit GatC [Methanoregulaceae archaeon]|jgi:aspartyl-tRNA(Asn)/glutamyl-tRNA(Gln) amidotransferase subunit C|nr:Asp-tRNA(Asn)/Glu-tRNA(Gln) amidotransferase subunit GatC [Methanoregulaceae archaeon]